MKTKAEFKKAGTSNGKRIALKIIAVAISVIALVATFLYLQNANNAALDTVNIVRLKRDLPAGTAISMADLERYAIIRREFDAENMIQFESNEDVEYIIEGKLTAYYLRRATPLYIDQLTDRRMPRDIILETLPEGYELTTVPYNYMEAGGNVLLPGDLIRMRVSYEVDAIPETDYDYVSGSYYQWTRKIFRTDIVFDSITVVDMLNSKGNSIYNIYMEAMRLSEGDRQELFRSSDFLSSVTPRTLKLALSPEDVERYNSYRVSVGDRGFLITILGRSSSSGIDFDAFTTIETEVRSWLDGVSAGR